MTYSGPERRHENAFNNPEFRVEMEDLFDTKLKPITALLEKHDSRLEEHDRHIQQGWIIAKVLSSLWAVLISFVMYVFRKSI